MSERGPLRRRTLLALTLVAGLAAPPARAQAPASGVRLDVMRARRDAAYVAWQQARRADSLAKAAGRTLRADTLRASGVLLVAPREVADSARRALSVFEARRQRQPLLPLTEGNAVYRLRPEVSRRRGGDSTMTFWYLDLLDAAGHEQMRDWWSRDPDAELLGRRLASDLLDRAAARLPTALGRWLEGGLPDTTRGDFWAPTYVAMATSPTLVARRCALGDLGGCRAALLLEPTRDPLVDWLSAEARLQIARSAEETVRLWQRDQDLSKRQATQRDAALRCYDTTDDASCIEFLRDFAPDVAKDPLGEYGRASLVLAALEMPGAPGITGALDKPSLSVTATLEAIAGRPFDRVLEHWRTHVLAARPARVVPSGPRVVVALGWLVLFAASATRGSRWR